MFSVNFIFVVSPSNIHPTVNLNAVKPLNSGPLRVLKNLSVIERCPLLRGNLKKIVPSGIKCFVSYSWHVHYLGCTLVGGFTVLRKLWRHYSQKEKFIKSLLAFVILMLSLLLEKDKIVAGRLNDQIEQTRILTQ